MVFYFDNVVAILIPSRYAVLDLALVNPLRSFYFHVNSVLFLAVIEGLLELKENILIARNSPPLLVHQLVVRSFCLFGAIE